MSKYLSQISVNAVPLIDPLSSNKSILNNFPSPRAFDHDRIGDLDTILALIVHLFWYGLRATIGTMLLGISEELELNDGLATMIIIYYINCDFIFYKRFISIMRK